MGFMKGISSRFSSPGKKGERAPIVGNNVEVKKALPITNNNNSAKKPSVAKAETAAEEKRGVIIHQPPWKIPAINDRFPNLVGKIQDDSDFNLYEYKGSNWAVIITHPADFSPVCTSEFVELLKMKSEFEANDIKIVGFGTDVTSDSHRKWIADVEAMVNGYDPRVTPNVSTDVKVDFPIFSDPTLEMAVELGILDCDTLDADGLPITARTMHVLTPDNVIALITLYPSVVGRNWKEALRSIVALQLVEQQSELIIIPSHWERGDKVLIDPKVSDSACEKIFGRGNWERVSLPSEVAQEVGTFIKGPGGVRIREDSKNKKSDDLDSVETCPRHYMRYASQVYK